jgi:hypothetical protein
MLLQQFIDNSQKDTTGRSTQVDSAVSCATREKTGEFGRYYTAQLLTISQLGSLIDTDEVGDLSNVDLIRKTTSCGATDAKDKILSLRRFLSPELRAALVSLDHGLRCNTQELYLRVAAFELQLQSMDVLGEAGQCQRSVEHYCNSS